MPIFSLTSIEDYCIFKSNNFLKVINMFAVHSKKAQQKVTTFDLKRMKNALNSQEKKASPGMSKEEKRAFLSGKL